MPPLPSLESLAGPALVALGLATLLVVLIRSNQRTTSERGPAGSDPAPVDTGALAPGVPVALPRQDVAEEATAPVPAPARVETVGVAPGPRVSLEKRSTRTGVVLADELEAELRAMRAEITALTEAVTLLGPGSRPARGRTARRSRRTRVSFPPQMGAAAPGGPETGLVATQVLDAGPVLGGADGYAVDLDELDRVLPVLQVPQATGSHEPSLPRFDAAAVHEPVLTAPGARPVEAEDGPDLPDLPEVTWAVPQELRGAETAAADEPPVLVVPVPTEAPATGAVAAVAAGAVALPVLDLGWDALQPVVSSGSSEAGATTWATPLPRTEEAPQLVGATQPEPAAAAVPPVLPVLPVLDLQAWPSAPASSAAAPSSAAATDRDERALPERAVETTAERPVAPVATAGYSEMSRELAASGRLRDAVLAQWAADLRVLAPLLGDRVSRLSRSLQSISPSDPATMLGSARAVAVMLADQSRLGDVIPSLDDLGHLSRRLVLAADHGATVPAREPQVPHAELTALESVLVRSAEAGGDGGHVSVSLRWDLVTHLASGVDHRVVRALLRESLEPHERDAFDVELAAGAR